MAATLDHARPRALHSLHPAHAILLAGTLPLFLGALLNDIAYAKTYQVQWTNFASWLIAGGLLLGACALVWAAVDLFRGHRDRRHIVYFALLLATWVLGFVNALVHGKDAWAVMPGGLVLSVAVTVLACVTTWVGFSGYRAGGAA